MTKEDAEQAVATFEYPPFTAHVGSRDITLRDGKISFGERCLMVLDPHGDSLFFDNLAEWITFYTMWERAHRTTMLPS